MESKLAAKFFALLLAFALVAGACGSDDDSSDAGGDGAADSSENTAGDDAGDDDGDDDGGDDDAGDAAAVDAPTEIVIGNPIAMSGPSSAGAGLSQIPSYDLWVADVNADGGIYVAEYDTKIPVRIERVDDTSDVGTAVQLTQQMLEDDAIDFIFPPWGTGANFAIAPIVSEAGMPTLGCTVGSKDLVDKPDQFPYFYTILNQAIDQGTGLVELIQDLGVESVAVIHHDDLHGIEFAEVVVPLLESAGVEILVNETYPVAADDLSQLLRQVQDSDAQGLLAFSYPAETFLITGQMAEIGLQPDLFFATVGIAFPVFRDAIHGNGGEGVMGAGAWNPNVDIEGAQGYFDRHVAMHGQEPDRWASAACYASGQVLQQAIEAAGTLDPEAVKAALDSTEFQTILGSFSFEGNRNPTYAGQVGQWQNGEFEIIAPIDARTAEPIFPAGG